MKKSLLIGNSINRLSNGNPSWSMLLDTISKELNLSFSLEKKPFPLAFEGILLDSINNDRKKIKQTISGIVKKIEPNEIHRLIMKLEVNHILTTNYDHSLEEADSGTNYSLCPKPLSTKYNLFRYYQTENNKKVWHIHGAADHSNSIVLGYDEYAGSLQRMRMYMKGYLYKGVKSPMKMNALAFDESSNSPTYSWIDIFLRDEIHIAGLGLEYEEIDIWWLLFYKAELKIENRDLGDTYIYYFDDVSKPVNPTRKAWISMLESFKVKTVPIQVSGDYQQAWKDLLSKIH